MQHHVYDLKQQKRGAVAVVSLNKRMNVRLMTISDYRQFKAGRGGRAIGGNAKTSPVRIPIPRDGHWVVVLDNGGAPYQVRAGVQVEGPPPRTSLPTREYNPASDVEVREPIEPIDEVLGGQTWDVFLSHATEDKATVAVPLRDALTARGVTVWLDKTEHQDRRQPAAEDRRRHPIEPLWHRGALAIVLRQGLDKPRARRARNQDRRW